MAARLLAGLGLLALASLAAASTGPSLPPWQAAPLPR